MRLWIYAMLFSYVAITSAAALHHRWSGWSGRNFLAALGDMLPIATLWLPGGGSTLLILGLRWLTIALIVHRLGRFVVLRRFELPFGFGKAWAGVALVGECLLILAVLLHVTSALINSQGLGALSMAPYVAAAVVLPLTFILVEVLSLRGYFRSAHAS